jgi:hypothetical protein
MAQISPASLLAAALLLGATCLVRDGAAAADPNTLWNIVHGKCVPDRLRTGAPDRCAAVHIRHGVSRGYAVLKDLRGPAQYLLIPTLRFPGSTAPPCWRRMRRTISRTPGGSAGSSNTACTRRGTLAEPTSYPHRLRAPRRARQPAAAAGRDRPAVETAGRPTPRASLPRHARRGRSSRCQPLQAAGVAPAARARPHGEILAGRGRGKISAAPRRLPHSRGTRGRRRRGRQRRRATGSLL